MAVSPVFGVNSKQAAEEAPTPTPTPGLILSPVPTDADALADAVDVLARAIGSRGPSAAAITPENKADTERVMGVASALVERYAPEAPQPVKNEAVIRCAGFLYGSDYGGIASEGAADQKVDYASHPIGGSNAFRRSGAMGLLSPWRVRRAG